MATETTEQQTKLTTSLVTALMLFLLATGAYYWTKSWRLTKLNDFNELRADSLLSVKLRLEGDIRSMESQLETATDNSASLDNHITDLHHVVNKRTAEIGRYRQQSSRQGRTIRQLNDQLTTLTTNRDSLENQLEAMRDKIGWLSNSNQLLLSQNKDLQKKVENLTTSLSTKVPISTITGDAFLVEATKSNHKQTAKAKKVHDLTVSLDIPAELQIAGTHDLFLSLTDSQHNAMMAPLRSTTVVLSDVNEVIPVHATQTVNFSRNPQRISFTLTPNGPIKPGKYRASVFTKDAYLGSVEFLFRDSFLFF
ncbi:hypothetical protein M0L20_13835 [Spirosoma sp. RP8]|uniref:Chromosome partitioning protein ParA n=1 Tax=Spirosoma liriopis TaxID=2937440 RepID=A0ABT0HLA9_9BACT|nr:hypothetical protein [Spirosoma liriopis]MCK8492943.1 hypothetical protein [Spirosoma liriopis]